MLISVITVTLNPGELLCSTVDSVRSQTCGDWELIVQDGGSTDNSLDLIPDDDRVCVVQEKDGGIYDAMNRALRKARGNYLLFLNAGDSLADTEIFSHVLQLAAEESQPELILCDYINLAGNRRMPMPKRLSSISLFRSVYCHQAVFFAGNLFKELGNYDVSFSVRADLEFLYRCHHRRPRVTVRHLGRCGIHYDGGGYSSRGELVKVKGQELKEIRVRHLPTWKRIWFSICHELTLVRLRTWWFRRSLVSS